MVVQAHAQFARLAHTSLLHMQGVWSSVRGSMVISAATE